MFSDSFYIVLVAGYRAYIFSPLLCIDIRYTVPTFSSKIVTIISY